MKGAIVGMVGKPPNVKIESVNPDIELAKWHEKMATYVPENQKRKYLKTAEKLRELDHLRHYIRHYDSCLSTKIDNDNCTCGLEK